MTDEDKKRIFEYMGWPVINTKGIGFIEAHNRGAFNHPLDAIDMVAAMNKMVEKGDWKDFDSYSCRVFVNDNSIKFDLSRETWTSWLMQPARFFELMVAWLKEKEHVN